MKNQHSFSGRRAPLASLALLGALLALTASARANQFDLSPSGNNDQDAANIQNALNSASAGDTIVFHGNNSNGADFYPSMRQGDPNNNLLMYQRNGSANSGNWITIKTDGNPVRLHLNGSSTSTGGLVLTNCSFVRIDGLEFIGNPNANPDSPGSFQGLILTGHDFQIVNCKISNFGGSGANAPDRSLFRNCVIHDCANLAHNGGSGITVGFPSGSSSDDLSHFASDNGERGNGGPNQPNTYGVVVVGNTCYNNVMQVEEYDYGSGTPVDIGILDGNGIIVDSSNNKSYPHNILVANNVCNGNGGNGINIFKSSHVDVYNNTCYNNSKNFLNLADSSVGAKEIVLGEGNNNSAFDNIAVASGSGKNVNAFVVYSESNDQYGNNLSYRADGGSFTDGVNYTSGGNDKDGQNPLFVDPSNDNFHIPSNSPAAGAGETWSWAYTGANYDRDGTPRGGTNDIGAYVASASSGDPSNLTAN